MFKALATPEEVGALQSFTSMLTSVNQVLATPKEAKLGKTATILANLRQNAFEEGYDDGKKAGLEVGRLEAIEAMQADCRAYAAQFAEELNSIANIVQSGIDQWYRSSEDSLAGLAMVVAARIVADELKTTPTAAVAIAKEAIAEVTHAEKATIRVNPFSSEILRENVDAIMAMSNSLKSLQIVEDPQILGGCVIESAGGRIDATIEFRVGAMLRAALEGYESGPAASSEIAA